MQENNGTSFDDIVIIFPSLASLQQHLLQLIPDQVEHIRFKNGVVGHKCIVRVRTDESATVWDAVHHISQQAENRQIELELEPLKQENFPVEEVGGISSRAAGSGYDFMEQWPPISSNEDLYLGWHLDDQHSQLGSARDEVWQSLKSGQIKETIKIAQIDTGIFPDHPVLAPNHSIKMELSKSFVDGEEESNPKAIDLYNEGKGQHGHGTGTLGLLSGWTIDPKYTDYVDIGYIGAIPFAEVIPFRTSDSVLIFNTENFVEAVEEAIKLGCEVITMSMGGKPSKRMARVVNKAYEAGITIVTAAGNYITQGIAGKVGPNSVVYPARYERVIAACGVCSNHLPYDFEVQEKTSGIVTRSFSTQFMQGNWGPPKAMEYALAAYTPNVPWLVKDDYQPLKKNGGGTSSATPQVAAAAALWIMKNKAKLKELGYHGNWKQVEAVRKVLFDSADKEAFADYQKYYGNGILKAKKALQMDVPEITEAMKSPEAVSSWTGVFEALDLFFSRSRSMEAPSPTQQEFLEIELEGLLLEYPEINDAFDQAEGDPDRQEQVFEQIRKIVGEKQCSKALKEKFRVD